MNLMYLVFGNSIDIHKQANFSILTFLTQKKVINKVIVVTDNPKYYIHITDDKFEIECISEQQLSEWKGPHNYFWRIKIKSIEYIFKKHPNHSIIYLDADTFLFKNLDILSEHLNNGLNVMHINEGKLSTIKSKTTSKMWKQIQNKTFGSIIMNEQHCMWNAGVVGISKLHFESSISEALKICDQMCSNKVTDRLIEQFALSVALSSTSTLVSVEHQIGHYWGNKNEWNKFIDDFFLTTLFSSLTFEEEQKMIEEINFSKIAVNIKIPNTRIRLIKKITKLFPDKYKIFMN